ncbi:hypothetical protein KPL74_02660 [Bacillus sp. NP157]|nr:hypothetical protein KPL74_02660 [Bacillus sp. NP157]
MLRKLRALPLALALAAPAIGATDVAMGGGNVHFTVPDNWTLIMQSNGDGESQVFEVPGASNADATLARVTITMKPAANLVAFQQFSGELRNRATNLKEYAAGKPKAPTENVYTAKEGTVKLDYYERYFFTSGYAVQLRCVRPAADAKFAATFDKACASVASSMPN